MTWSKLILGFFGFFFFCQVSEAQSNIEKKKIAPIRTANSIKVDGLLNEADWAAAPIATEFVQLRPTPFLKETPELGTTIKIMYNNEGICIGGYLKELTKDSISSELVGRDGFGNNDFVGVVFDTYLDKINGFEYFVTPLGEQMDAKTTAGGDGNNEDFSWNAVWQSASKIHNDGWSFEMFIPYAAIRFSKKALQDWGLNIIRKRTKSGQQLFWQSIDPQANGFLTQEGFMVGLQDIKPPLRLQLSPYFSTYNEKGAGSSSWKARVNGGADIKYGINQAFTLDMTLIPDFGQVVTDNQFLNLSPFGVQFTENRPFFTEGTELFSKGDLFYSRRIGLEPSFRNYPKAAAGDSILEDPNQAKIINATKISGRTKNGLGIGLLNAVTAPQYTKFFNKVTGNTFKEESMALSNYNILVLNQSLKNNSALTLVNTNVLRSGKDRDANVTAALFDLNNKTNTYGLGGSVTISNIYEGAGKPTTGYAHSISFGKTSGRFNFRIWHDLTNNKFDKSDMGFFTNNNEMNQGFFMGYVWNKPRAWYNRINISFNGFYSRLVTPIDVFAGRKNMSQFNRLNANINIQTKKLQFIAMGLNGGFRGADFYESRVFGRTFKYNGRIGMWVYYQSNDNKKYSWSFNPFVGHGGVFPRTSVELNFTEKIRFNKKLSVEHVLNTEFTTKDAGWAATLSNPNPINAQIVFAKRNLNVAENVINAKYNFTNRMGITLRMRHSWSKVQPMEFYNLNLDGSLTPTIYADNRNQNYNFFSSDLVYNWQFDQGSFLTVAWKQIGQNFSRTFASNYFKNLGNTVEGPQLSSVSVRLIYFIDYATLRGKYKAKKSKKLEN